MAFMAGGDTWPRPTKKRDLPRKVEEMLAKVAAFSIVLAVAANTGQSGEERHHLSAVEGRLAAIVPTRDGILVAADTRSIVAGIACDGFEKIIVPNHDLRASIVFAGVEKAALTTGRPLHTCEEALSLTHGLNFRRVMQNYLDGVKDITSLNLRELARLCSEEALAFQALSATLHRPFLQDRRDTVLLIFAIINYDPDGRQARVGMAALTVNADDTISSTVASDQQFERSSPAPLLLLGDAAFVQDQVFGGSGSEYLDWDMLDAISRQRLSNLDQTTAVSALNSIFATAAQVAADTMAVAKFGTAIQFVLVGSGARPSPIKPR